MKSELLTLRIACAHHYRPDKFHTKCDVCGLPRDNKVHLARYIKIQQQRMPSNMVQIVEESNK